MKRVKVMLSAILVMAIVAGALAFKAKTDDVCVYTRTLANGPSNTVCNFATLDNFITDEGANDEYATTITKPTGNCPATATCDEFVKTIAE